MKQPTTSSVTRPRAARALVLIAAAVLAAANGAPTSAAAKVSGSGLNLLARLATAPEHATGYARSLFVIWVDADKDGCDTRDEVLIAESAAPPHVTAGCSVEGSWRSAYDGLTTTNPSRFDIDHVVPLKEAWDSGAWSWTPERRKSYANDLGDWRSLRAVSAASNRSKGDKDPAQWLPPLGSFRCTYATEWVVVKLRWTLSVDDRERVTLKQILTACPSHKLAVAIIPDATSSPSPTPSATPTSALSPASTSAAVGACDPNDAGSCVSIVSYDLDCADIRHRVVVVGVDIHGFDGDHDGIGCESYG